MNRVVWFEPATVKRECAIVKRRDPVFAGRYTGNQEED